MTDTDYQVLARKYRPQTFADLIGQEAMVRTLTNAFATGRIAHAFMLTGVRGVGKTTTARLLARALNYEPDGPSIELDPPGAHCEAIAESSHPDVMEMDAASRTGVGDIREILDGVRYAATSARTKVYIIDEVHMLSTSAFNALLKTLEEPPAHVKFIFATTEIRKVPVTVLSRCQRFDLRRVPPDQLIAHLQNICAKEKADVDEAALALIARAAEGSVRDALSLLDQAIVIGGGETVGAEEVRDMLGLADRSRTFDLFALALSGDGAATAKTFVDLHGDGADPLVLMRDLLDHCHETTRAKALGEAASLTGAPDQIARVRDLADATAMGALARAWQMLLKAYEEARGAPDPSQAVEMGLLRLAHGASLPPPEEAARMLAGGGSSVGGAPASSGGAAPSGGGATARLRVAGGRDVEPAADYEPDYQGAPAARAPEPDIDQPQTLADIAMLAEVRRDIMLKSDIERFIRPVRVEPLRIDFEPAEGAPPDLAGRLVRRLQEWTGERWMVSAETSARGGETLAENRAREHAQMMEAIKQTPMVAAALKLWPEAQIVEVRDVIGEAEEG